MLVDPLLIDEERMSRLSSDDRLAALHASAMAENHGNKRERVFVITTKEVDAGS